MHDPELSPAATAALHAGLASEHLDPSYAAFVVRHLDADDATWRWCCGSHCDPCVQRLGRVVDRVRAAVDGRSDGEAEGRDLPPGLPGPHGPA